MTRRWYLAKDGKSDGPYEQSEVVRRFAAGEFTPAQLVCAEGDTNWQPISNEPELFGPTVAPQVVEIPSPPPWVVARIGTPNQNKNDALGWALIYAPTCAGMLTAFVATRSIQFAIWAVAIAACACFTNIDSKRWGLRSELYTAAMLLAWIFAYPTYCYARAKRGAPARWPAAFVAMLLFGVGPMLGSARQDIPPGETHFSRYAMKQSATTDLVCRVLPEYFCWPAMKAEMEMASHFDHALSPAFAAGSVAEGDIPTANQPFVPPIAAEAGLTLLEARRQVHTWRFDSMDDECVGQGKPPHAFKYGGATFATNRLVATADGCVSSLSFESDTWMHFCCP